MKLLILILLILVVCGIVKSSHFECDRYQCLPGYECILDNSSSGGGGGIYKCVNKVKEVTIKQTIENSWIDGNNCSNSKINVEIINHTDRIVKNIIIATDVQLSNGQIWGAELKNEFLISLPDYIKIQPAQKHTFGYINKNDHPAHLWVQNINLITVNN